MARLLVYGLLIGVMLCAVVLLKTYRYVDAKELKRKAREGDELAKSLYQVVGLGKGLDIVLWLVIAISAGFLFALLAQQINFWLSTAVIICLILLSFAWLPKTGSSKVGRRLAAHSVQPLHFLVAGLYPLLRHIEDFTLRHRPVTSHTGLYTKQDVIDLLKQQKHQLDNRIPKTDLATAIKALRFSNQLVRTAMVPLRSLKMVKATDLVGPLLMEELHKTGQQHFVVYDKDESNLIGSLTLKSVIAARQGGSVKSLIKPEVHYIKEEDSLITALRALLKNNSEILIAVNSLGEIAGSLSLDDVISQLIDLPAQDESEEHDNKSAVSQVVDSKSTTSKNNKKTSKTIKSHNKSTEEDN